MGLNLETLIVILFVLILVIVGDGIRRVLRDRRSRLRVRIDPGLRDLPEDDDALERNPELPSGSARVVRRDTQAEPRIGDVSEVDEPHAGPPPVVMEPEEERAPSASNASQPDLFGEHAQAAH